MAEDFPCPAIFYTWVGPRAAKVNPLSGKEGINMIVLNSSLLRVLLKFLCRIILRRQAMMENPAGSGPSRNEVPIFPPSVVFTHKTRTLFPLLCAVSNSMHSFSPNQLYSRSVLQFARRINWASYMGLPNHGPLSSTEYQIGFAPGWSVMRTVKPDWGPLKFMVSQKLVQELLRSLSQICP